MNNTEGYKVDLGVYTHLYLHFYVLSSVRRSIRVYISHWRGGAVGDSKQVSRITLGEDAILNGLF